MEKRYRSGVNPEKCPKCGSERIARILLGMPIFSEQLDADIQAGRIVLGGCEMNGDDPAWQCKECETEIYRK